MTKMSNQPDVPLSRLNEFSKALSLDRDPGPLSDDERLVYEDMKAERERYPGVTFFPVDE